MGTNVVSNANNFHCPAIQNGCRAKPLETPKVVSLQLNGMLLMWKIQQAMQEDAIQVTIIYQGSRAEMFISENFQLAYRDPGWKNRDLGNRASPLCHRNTSKLSQRI